MNTELIDTETVPAPVARGVVRPAYAVLGVALLAAAIVMAADHDTGAWPVLVFVVLPDLALLVALTQPHLPGQLPPRAVPAYNLMHHPAAPATLAGSALLAASPTWMVAAVTWAAHIAIDRGAGYGLRSRDGWQRG